MSQAITAVATWAEITAAPQDGDDAAADTGTAPLVPNVLQVLADRDCYITTCLHGLIVGRVEAYGEADGIVVGSFGIWMNGLFYTRTGGAIAVISGLSVQWYYLYAYISSGLVAIEVSGTAPAFAGGYAFKTGDTSRRYLTCFYATAAAVLRPFRSIDGHYVYRPGAAATTATMCLALNSGQAVSFAAGTVSLAAYVPLHSMSWRLTVAFRAQVAGYGSWQLRPNGQTTNSHGSAQQGTDILGEFATHVEMVRDSAGTTALEYLVADNEPAGALPYLSIFVDGFRE